MFDSLKKRHIDVRDSVKSYGVLLLAILSFLLICEILIFLMRLFLG